LIKKIRLLKHYSLPKKEQKPKEKTMLSMPSMPSMSSMRSISTTRKPPISNPISHRSSFAVDSSNVSSIFGRYFLPAIKESAKNEDAKSTSSQSKFSNVHRSTNVSSVSKIRSMSLPKLRNSLSMGRDNSSIQNSYLATSNNTSVLDYNL